MVNVFFVPALPIAHGRSKERSCHPTMTSEKKSPLFSLPELREAGAAMTLYPLSAFRAMAAAAEGVYRRIRETGSQAEVVSSMQTRVRLYEILDYHRYERKLDEPFGSKS
jgi:methylisocitrate lyase